MLRSFKYHHKLFIDQNNEPQMLQDIYTVEEALEVPVVKPQSLIWINMQPELHFWAI